MRPDDRGEHARARTHASCEKYSRPMQTQLADFIRDTPEGREADAILRKCVHCGFCTATCPTYQVLGDDLDSPRGRIYLIKRVLEGAPVTGKTRLHLDRCLTCRACETTCPSGRALRAAGGHRPRAWSRSAPARPAGTGCRRAALAFGLPRTGCSSRPCGSGGCRALLPASWKKKIPPARARRRMARAAPRAQDAGARAAACSRRSRRRSTPRRRACSTASASRSSKRPAPDAAARVRFHLNRPRGRPRRHARADRRLVAAGRARRVEAIVMTASGCGVTVKDYGHLLANDPAYRDKAARISALARDLCEVVPARGLPAGQRKRRRPRRFPVAVHAAARPADPRPGGGAARARRLRDRAGARCALCCGSAGTYSLLQPAIAGELRRRKLAALQEGGAATASPRPISAASRICRRRARAGAALDRAGGRRARRRIPLSVKSRMTTQSCALPARTTAPTPAACW